MSSVSNFSYGYAPAITTNLPVSPSIKTLPGVPVIPNNLCPSDSCAATTSAKLPPFTHDVNFAVLYHSLVAVAISPAMLRSVDANTASMYE